MPARRTWVLLLLAALFAMHGVLTASADPGHSTSAVAQVGMVSTETSAVPPADSGSVSAGAGMAGAEATPVHASVPVDGGVGHFLALCLAVLVTGVIGLGVAALSRIVPPMVAAGHSSLLRSTVRWPKLPRPPDLSELCLLRI